MVAKNRKVDMRGLTLMVGGLELDGVNFADNGAVEATSLAIEGNDYTFVAKQYKATVTVANGATTGKEAAIGMPAGFRPQMVAVEVTVASTNASNLQDIGDDADTDSFVDGLAISVATTGYKGTFACNGTRGYPGGTAGSGTELITPDEVEVVISADPGASGVTMELTFYGHQIVAV